MAVDLRHEILQMDTAGGTSYYPSGGSIQSIVFGGNADTETTILLHNVDNLVRNGNFSDWSAGTSAAPDGWVLAGTAATVAREGTVIRTPLWGEVASLGSYSCLVTRVGNDLTLSQNVLNHLPASDPRSAITYWRGRYISAGMWLNCTTAAQAKIETYDGTTTTASSDHGGSDVWTWLSTAPALVAADATELTIRAVLDTGNDGLYLSGAIMYEAIPIFQAHQKTGNGLSIAYPKRVPFKGLILHTATGGVLQVQI